MMRRIVCVAVALAFLLTGCRTMGDGKTKFSPVTVPAAYSTPGNDTPPDEKWWAMFSNNELNTLIAEARENNFDLKTLRARIAQASAILKKERASLLPGLDYSFGGQKKGTQVKTSRSSSSVYDGSHSWDASLSGSWTPDIWGENDASVQSRQFNVTAAQSDLAYTGRELAAQLAGIWIDIIAVRKKKKILASQIRVNAQQLDLQKLRYTNGKANALDVSQQREALAEVRSQGPLLEREEQLLFNALAFLSGRSSTKGFSVTTTEFPDLKMIPSLGVPADLLGSRPDIRAARQRLSSSQWQVAAAEADLLPSLALTANALFSSGKLDLLFSNWVATLTAALAGPIFDGGYKKAEIERVNAAAEEQLSLYARTVAQAIRQVEDSLVTIATQDDFIRLLEEELSLARLTLKDAQLQYWNGKSSYLNYLTVLTRVEQLERQLIGEKADTIKERIELHRALGFRSISNEKETDQAEQIK